MKRKIRFVAILSLLTLIPLPSYTHASEILQFEVAARRVIEYSSEIKSAYAAIGVQQGEVCQASLFANPVFCYEIENIGTPCDELIQSTYSLTQAVELSNKRGYRTQVACAGKNAAIAHAEVVKRNLMLQLKQAMIRVVTAQEKLHLIEKKAQLKHKIVEITRSGMEAGKQTPMALKKAEIAASVEQFELVQNQAQLNQARHELAMLWGESCPSFSCVAYPLRGIHTPLDSCTLLTYLPFAPEAMEWAQAVRAAQADRSLQYAEAIPDVEVLAGYRHFQSCDKAAYVFAFCVPLPIFNRNQGNIKKSHYQTYQAEIEQENGIRKLEIDFWTIYQALVSTYDQARDYICSILQPTLEALLLTEQGHKEGKFDTSEVLEARQLVYEAVEPYINILADYHLQKAQLERLLGVSPCNSLCQMMEACHEIWD